MLGGKEHVQRSFDTYIHLLRSSYQPNELEFFVISQLPFTMFLHIAYSISCVNTHLKFQHSNSARCGGGVVSLDGSVINE